MQGLIEYIATVCEVSQQAAEEIYSEIKAAGIDLLQVDALDWDDYLDAYLCGGV